MGMGSYLRGLGKAIAGDVPDVSQRDPNADFWYSDVTSVLSHAGVPVTPDNALRVPACSASVNRLSGSLQSLPVRVFRKRGDAKEQLPDHPVAQLFRGVANPLQTGTEFMGEMEFNRALRSNALAEILRDGDGQVAQLRRIAPGTWRVLGFNTAGEPEYEVSDPRTGYGRRVPADRVWHLKALPYTTDGACGVSVVETGRGRDVIGQALALQLFTSRFFANDTRSGGIIKNPGTFKTDDDRKRYIERLREGRSGKNAYRDWVLEFGFDYVASTIDAEKSQMTETRKQLAIEVAQLWNMQPHKIGILDKAAFSNIEQQAIEYVTDTLLPPIRCFESRIKADLILEDDVFVELDVLGLLRGDVKTRYEAYALGRNWGWLSVNDVRRLENMDPIDDGDVYLRPANMLPADAPAPSPEPEPEPVPEPAPPPKESAAVKPALQVIAHG